ncbi:MAG: hypothetical protein KC656_07550, partial [Myxococcales bacterium]|nr:hypothetical protein [Myxococcales bacterium]
MLISSMSVSMGGTLEVTDSMEGHAAHLPEIVAFCHEVGVNVAVTHKHNSPAFMAQRTVSATVTPGDAAATAAAVAAGWNRADGGTPNRLRDMKVRTVGPGVFTLYNDGVLDQGGGCEVLTEAGTVTHLDIFAGPCASAFSWTGGGGFDPHAELTWSGPGPLTLVGYLDLVTATWPVNYRFTCNHSGEARCYLSIVPRSGEQRIGHRWLLEAMQRADQSVSPCP